MRITAMNGIECPGDTIPYDCFILSNSETIHLTWSVILSGQLTNSVTYSTADSGFNNRTNLDTYIITSLTAFKTDEFIRSTLEVIVQPNIPIHGVEVECSISDLGSASVSVVVNRAGKKDYR